MLADSALALACQAGDLAGEARARVTRGFHGLYFAAPEQARAELALAFRCFESTGDRAGQLPAQTGVGRALWRGGQEQQALDHLLPLRDEGLQLLKDEQRGVLLNDIAGCYSAQGRSEQAFADMHEALRGAGPARGHGFDAALHCSPSHELLQLGGHDEVLAHVDLGLARCPDMRNARLKSVLRINPVIGLTVTGRAAKALPDVQRLCEPPPRPARRCRSRRRFRSRRRSRRRCASKPRETC